MNKKNKLSFGTAGLPLSTPSPVNTLQGIKQVRRLGLEALELEFVQGIYLTSQKALEVKKTAKKENIILTCHAPYYINLCSLEKRKIKESKERILKSARISWLAGAKSLTFHAGFYLKRSKEKVYQLIKKQIKEIIKELREEGNFIQIRPETTGKLSQWGSWKEILRLSQELEGLHPCFDFSHIYARSQGKINNFVSFKKILEEIEVTLGQKELKDLHLHLSGITYGSHGERHHLNLAQSSFRYQELLLALKEFSAQGILISESPNLEEDALLMQQVYHQLSI